MDRIAIHDIRAFGRHGWTAEERSTPQRLRIDLELELDLRRAGESDELADTVDYAALHRRIVATVETSSYALLERLGDALLDTIFADRRIVSATLQIAKPGILDGATPAVALRRDNARSGR